jgi:hypothetical protein
MIGSTTLNFLACYHNTALNDKHLLFDIKNSLSLSTPAFNWLLLWYRNNHLVRSPLLLYGFVGKFSWPYCTVSHIANLVFRSQSNQLSQLLHYIPFVSYLISHYSATHLPCFLIISDYLAPLSHIAQDSKGISATSALLGYRSSTLNRMAGISSLQTTTRLLSTLNISINIPIS